MLQCTQYVERNCFQLALERLTPGTPQVTLEPSRGARHHWMKL